MSEYTFQHGDHTVTLTKEEYDKIQATFELNADGEPQLKQPIKLNLQDG